MPRTITLTVDDDLDRQILSYREMMIEYAAMVNDGRTDYQDADELRADAGEVASDVLDALLVQIIPQEG